jgi:fibro-slime domain-containing protein
MRQAHDRLGTISTRSIRTLGLHALAVVAIGGCSSEAEKRSFDPGSGGTMEIIGAGGSSPSAGGSNMSSSAGSLGIGGTLEQGGTGGGPGDGDGGNGAQTCDGKLKGVIRDFMRSFPDMEVQSHVGSKCYCDDRGIVGATLGADRKPVYAGDATNGTSSTTGKDNFDKWYRDTDAVNQSSILELQFVDPDKDGVFTYDNQQFFPIDDMYFGNEGDPHNYHFTFELHTTFKYKGSEKFTFVGDDDVFVFIDGKRVVDLGGVHSAENGPVDVDTLGLTKGSTYPLDFFFAERHVTESHFRLDTSLEFIDCGAIIVK